MKNKWNNKIKLPTLKVDYSGGVLTCRANGEIAKAYIAGNDIKKVEFFCGGRKVVVDKKDRYHVVVGENNWQRDVYHYLKPGGEAPIMRLGITKHRGEGTWSSLPHKFELNTEPGFEEVFFYLLEKGSKRAIQVGKGAWSDNKQVDSAWFVYDRTFSVVPMGYHPVVGEPGVKVSYIWVYLAKRKDGRRSNN